MTGSVGPVEDRVTRQIEKRARWAGPEQGG